MKIAIFTETYLPYINGVVTHIKILKEGLEKKGNQVLIVTADKNKVEHVLENGILRCPALEFKKLYGYGLASPLSPTLEKMIREFNPDVIHIQQEFGLGLAGIKCARRLNVPLIYTLHTMYDDYIYYIAQKPFTEIVKKISHRYIRFVARRADIITGPSQKCAEYLHSAGVNRKVRVIPNSVEVEKYRKDATTEEERQKIKDKLSIPKDAFVACFCGRVGKEKGIDELLRLWKEKTDDKCFLIIMGDGPEREELTLLAKNYGLDKRVIFTGAMPHDELVPYYALSDAYATASLSEMYSISMLEAQASGLYVIQKLDPENACQIKVGINGEIFNSDEEFAQIIENLRKMTPQEREQHRETVRESVKDRSSDTIADYLLELYNLALSRRKKGITYRNLREDNE